MAKRKHFIFREDLEALSDEAREKYRIEVCEFFGVPEETRLIDLVLMDTGNGPKKLVLYTKSGATDIIRDNFGISTKLGQAYELHGSVVVPATATTKDGRQEEALGAVNVTGTDAAKALMVAQTKAVRRVTIRIVAGGHMLDEMDLPSGAVKVVSTLTTPPAQPTVTANSAPGQVKTDPVIAPEIIRAGEEIAHELAKTAEELQKIAASAEQQTPAPTQPETIVSGRKLIRGSSVALSPEASKVFVEAILNPSAPNEALQTAAAVSTDSPQKPATVSSVSSEGNAPVESASTAQASAGVVPEDKQRKKELMKELRALVHDQLEPGGLIASENYSVWRKIDGLVDTLFEGLDSYAKLSGEQLEYLIGFIKGKLDTIGVGELVKFINAKCGVE